MYTSSRPKKSLGQNFLHDENVIRKIIKTIQINPTDIILEIGPGKGALTRHILQIVPHMTAVELDAELASALTVEFGEKLSLLNSSVLRFDLAALSREQSKKIRIIGNIPYNITSPILFWVIESSEAVQDATLMMQREVAQRLVAKPRTKEYGILSVFAQYYTNPQMNFAVSPGSFFPVPDVISAVMTLSFGKMNVPRAVDDVLFRTVVRGTFGKRRKTLRNGLRSMGANPDLLDIFPINLDQRPEELTVAEFVSMTEEIQKRNITLSLNPADAGDE